MGLFKTKGKQKHQTFVETESGVGWGGLGWRGDRVGWGWLVAQPACGAMPTLKLNVAKGLW